MRNKEYQLDIYGQEHLICSPQNIEINEETTIDEIYNLSENNHLYFIVKNGIIYVYEEEK